MLDGHHGRRRRRRDPGSRATTARAGIDLYATVVTGSGGFGDPLEREAASVALDVANGHVSRAVAESVYGVILTDCGAVDDVATTERRDAVRAERLACDLGPGASVPFVISDPARRPYSEALEILAAENGAVIACERCHHVLCSATENYKTYTRQRATPVSALPRGTDPARYGMTDTADLRAYFCPSCGVQFETEIAKTGDPSLHAVELDVAALQLAS